METTFSQEGAIGCMLLAISDFLQLVQYYDVLMRSMDTHWRKI